MDKKIYFNAPCGLFRGFLEDELSRKRVLNDVLDFECFRQFIKLSDIKDEEIRFQRVRDILILKNGDRESTIERGKSLALLHANEPFFSIPRDTYWEFYNTFKSGEECAMLVAYLALKSICGKKQFAKTNKAMWLSRMDGKSRPQYQKKKDGKLELVLSDGLAKYRTNYGIRRLRALLFEYYKVSFYSKSVHGFCFSTTLSLTDLILTIKNEPSDTKRIDSQLIIATKKAEAKVEELMVRMTEAAENEGDTDELPF